MVERAGSPLKQCLQMAWPSEHCKMSVIINSWHILHAKSSRSISMLAVNLACGTGDLDISRAERFGLTFGFAGPLLAANGANFAMSVNPKFVRKLERS